MKGINTKKPRQVIKTEDDVLDFGKYKDCTVADVLHDDPEYILWLDDEKIVEFSDSIIREAEEWAYRDDAERPYGMSWYDCKED